MSATGTAPADSRIAVGASVGQSIIPTLLGIIGFFLVTVGGGLALVILNARYAIECSFPYMAGGMRMFYRRAQLRWELSWMSVCRSSHLFFRPREPMI